MTPEPEDHEPDPSPRMSLTTLLDAMEAQHAAPNVSNRTRGLLLMAAQVIVQQAQRIVALERDAKQSESRIILPG